MAKKKKFTEETFEEVSQEFERFDNIAEKQAEQIMSVLSIFVEGYEKTPKDVVDVFEEKLSDVKENAKNRYGTALSRTKNHFARGGRRSAKPYVGIIIGVEHRVTDINSQRIRDLESEYKDSIANGTAENVEIELSEYNDLYAEFNKIKASSSSDAVTFMKDSLAGRFVVYDSDNPDEKEMFIEKLDKWSSGATNFNFGRILKPNPSLTATCIILEDGEVKLVDISIKGEAGLSIIQDAPIYEPVMIKVVKNEKEGQRWYIDKSFEIKIIDDPKSILGTDDPIKMDKKMIDYTLNAVPNDLQTTVDGIDSWQRKMSKKLKSSNILGLVKGTVKDIYYNDDGGASITLGSDNVDLDDLDIWTLDDDDEDGSDLRLKVTANHIDLIDFDIDSVIYGWCEFYRGAKYDSETRTYLRDQQADMPSGNVWGIIADPDLKRVRVEPAMVSAESLEVEEEEEEDDEDGSGFVIEE